MKKSDTPAGATLLSTTIDLYDLSMLEELEDNEYMMEIIGAVLSESPKDINEMKEALHAGKTDIICQKAHKLKSSAGVIQAERLTGLLADIEKCGKNGLVTEQLSSLVDDVIFEYNRIEISLKIYILKMK